MKIKNTLFVVKEILNDLEMTPRPESKVEKKWLNTVKKAKKELELLKNQDTARILDKIDNYADTLDKDDTHAMVEINRCYDWIKKEPEMKGKDNNE